MLEDVRINCTDKKELNEFLIDHGFTIEELVGEVLSVHRPGELPVFISRLKSSLFFKVDLGAVSAITDPDIYRQILLLNTERLPVNHHFLPIIPTIPLNPPLLTPPLSRSRCWMILQFSASLPPDHCAKLSRHATVL